MLNGHLWGRQVLLVEKSEKYVKCEYHCQAFAMRVVNEHWNTLFVDCEIAFSSSWTSQSDLGPAGDGRRACWSCQRSNGQSQQSVIDRILSVNDRQIVNMTFSQVETQGQDTSTAKMESQSLILHLCFDINSTHWATVYQSQVRYSYDSDSDELVELDEGSRVGWHYAQLSCSLCI